MWSLLITSWVWPIEGVAVSDPLSRYLLILLVKLCKGGVNSPDLVSVVGTCVSYDGAGFADFPAVR